MGQPGSAASDVSTRNGNGRKNGGGNKFLHSPSPSLTESDSAAAPNDG